MITLKNNIKPLSLSIEFVDQVIEEPEGPVAEAEQIVELLFAARDVIAAQDEEITRLRELLATRDAVEEVKNELSETREMISEIERDLQAVRPTRIVVAPSRSFDGLRMKRPYSPKVRQVLDGEPLFLDLETTGLAKDAKIVEVAVVDAEGQVLLSTLVNPGCHIPAEASAVNGVYDQDVADASTWEQVAPQLEALLSGRTVIAHNAGFEKKFLPEWGVKWICSKKMADAAMGKAPYAQIMHNPMRGGSLEARLYQCGLKQSELHTAAGDCINTLRLVRYLAGDDRPVELIY